MFPKVLLVKPRCLFTMSHPARTVSGYHLHRPSHSFPSSSHPLSRFGNPLRHRGSKRSSVSVQKLPSSSKSSAVVICFCAFIYDVHSDVSCISGINILCWTYKLQQKLILRSRVFKQHGVNLQHSSDDQQSALFVHHLKYSLFSSISYSDIIHVSPRPFWEMCPMCVE